MGFRGGFQFQEASVIVTLANDFKAGMSGRKWRVVDDWLYFLGDSQEQSGYVGSRVEGQLLNINGR